MNNILLIILVKFQRNCCIIKRQVCILPRMQGLYCPKKRRLWQEATDLDVGDISEIKAVVVYGYKRVKENPRMNLSAFHVFKIKMVHTLMKLKFIREEINKSQKEKMHIKQHSCESLNKDSCFCTKRAVHLVSKPASVFVLQYALGVHLKIHIYQSFKIIIKVMLACLEKKSVIFLLCICGKRFKKLSTLLKKNHSCLLLMLREEYSHLQEIRDFLQIPLKRSREMSSEAGEKHFWDGFPETEQMLSLPRMLKQSGAFRELDNCYLFKREQEGCSI